MGRMGVGGGGGKRGGVGVGKRAEALRHPNALEENTVFCVQRAAGLSFQAEGVGWWFQRRAALRKIYMA